MNNGLPLFTVQRYSQTILLLVLFVDTNSINQRKRMAGKGKQPPSLCSRLCSCLATLMHIVLFPVYLVFFFFFMFIWGFFTFSGIGPLLQCWYNSADRKKLDPQALIQKTQNPSFRLVTIPAGVHGSSLDKDYRVFVIYSKPAVPSKYPPVCIPNGLGATATLISQMQEKLVEAGFAVLSFDRMGVGLSDINPSRKSPTAVDLVREMDYVMNVVEPGGSTKWILLGPSMGSIVAQCYMSVFPDKVVGFLNMDGLPYPFLKHSSSFMWAAWIYKVYASIVWTGIMRPFIGMGLKSNQQMFACTSFPLEVAIAQVNQRNFFYNLALEMWTMMDCCEMAEVAWGKQSILRLPAEHIEALVRAPPTVSIDFDAKTGARHVTNERSDSEVGEDWIDAKRVQEAVSFLTQPSRANSQASADNKLPAGQENTTTVRTPSTANDPLLKFDALEHMSKSHGADSLLTGVASTSMLGDVFSRLVVRVMSGRNHDFGNAMANSFYSQDMRDLSAAEHSKHALLALQGARTVYPTLTHTVVFSKTDDIVRHIQEIGQELLKNGSLSNTA